MKSIKHSRVGTSTPHSLGAHHMSERGCEGEGEREREGERSINRRAVKYTLPAAAPGDAGSALPITFAALSAFGSNVG